MVIGRQIDICLTFFVNEYLLDINDWLSFKNIFECLLGYCAMFLMFECHNLCLFSNTRALMHSKEKVIHPSTLSWYEQKFWGQDSKVLKRATCDECKMEAHYSWRIQIKKQTTCLHLLASKEKGKTCEKMKTKRENL